MVCMGVPAMACKINMFSIIAMYWMNGAWYVAPTLPSVRDINGRILNVGDMVKIVGMVVSINQTDAQYGSVAVLPEFPGQAILGVSSLATVYEG